MDFTYEIVKPDRPGLEDETPYPYLAGVEVQKNILKHCCVREAKVKAINSLTTITVEYNGSNYPNVPVWIHTDYGARKNILEGAEKDNPAEYFARSALMFTTLDTIVYALVFTDPETKSESVVSVINIDENTSESPPPTYRPFLKFKIRLYTSLFYDDRREFFLYDVINDRIANIPTWNSTTEPELPFFDAEGLRNDLEVNDIAKLNNFLDRGFSYINYDPTATATLHGDLLVEWGDAGAAVSSSCRGSSGALVSPAYTGTYDVRFANLTGACYGSTVSWDLYGTAPSFEYDYPIILNPGYNSANINSGEYEYSNGARLVVAQTLSSDGNFITSANEFYSGVYTVTINSASYSSTYNLVRGEYLYLYHAQINIAQPTANILFDPVGEYVLFCPLRKNPGYSGAPGTYYIRGDVECLGSIYGKNGVFPLSNLGTYIQGRIGTLFSELYGDYGASKFACEFQSLHLIPYDLREDRLQLPAGE